MRGVHVEGTWIPRPSVHDCRARRQEALSHPHHGEQGSSGDIQAHTPYRNWLTLDAAMRSSKQSMAGHIRRVQHVGMRNHNGGARFIFGTQRASYFSTTADRRCGTVEHYHDEESLQTYVRREVAPRVRQLLTRNNVTWNDLHILLSRAHLRLEKAESADTQSLPLTAASA